MQRPRELRRRVVVPARLRDGRSWSDTCILNISSRGLMIQTSRPLTPGSQVEIRRGDHVILARVVWRDGARSGLETDERVPVEDIMTLGQSMALQLTADNDRERRRRPRIEDESRLHARSIEYVAAVLTAVTLATAVFILVQEAFVRPVTLLAAALGG